MGHVLNFVPQEFIKVSALKAAAGKTGRAIDINLQQLEKAEQSAVGNRERSGSVHKEGEGSDLEVCSAPTI